MRRSLLGVLQVLDAPVLSRTRWLVRSRRSATSASAISLGKRLGELVRELRREPPLVAQAGREAVEQRVERCTEACQLVVRDAETSATIKVRSLHAAA